MTLDAFYQKVETELSGVDPYPWKISVYLQESGLFIGLVYVGLWHVETDSFDTVEETLKESRRERNKMCKELGEVEPCQERS